MAQARVAMMPGVLLGVPRPRLDTLFVAPSLLGKGIKCITARIVRQTRARGGHG